MWSPVAVPILVPIAIVARCKTCSTITNPRMGPSWLLPAVHAARKTIVLGSALIIHIYRVIQDAHEWSKNRPDKKVAVQNVAPVAEAPPAAADAPVM